MIAFIFQTIAITRSATVSYVADFCEWFGLPLLAEWLETKSIHILRTDINFFLGLDLTVEEVFAVRDEAEKAEAEGREI